MRGYLPHGVGLETSALTDKAHHKPSKFGLGLWPRLRVFSLRPGCVAARPNTLVKGTSTSGRPLPLGLGVTLRSA